MFAPLNRRCVMKFARSIVLTLATLTFTNSGFAASFVTSQGYDCRITCGNAGTAFSTGLSPASWGQWGNRRIDVCRAYLYNAWVYGYNMAARPGSNVDFDRCNVAGGGTQHKV